MPPELQRTINDNDQHEQQGTRGTARISRRALPEEPAAGTAALLAAAQSEFPGGVHVRARPPDRK